MASIYYFSHAANLLVCLLGLAWMSGGDARRRDMVAYRGWLVFWIGTGTYYGISLAGSAGSAFLPWWVSQLPLYVATGSLLAAYLLTTSRFDKYPASVLGAVVVIVVVASGRDVQEVGKLRLAGWHQGLSCVALLLWALRLRHRNPDRSVLIALYALAQLPLLQLAPPFVRSSVEFGDFVGATFWLYVAGKIPLISGVHYAVRRPEPAQLVPYQVDNPDVIAASEPWDVFVSYAFEELTEARALHQSLKTEGIRAFVASDHLSAMAGTLEWSALIDDMLASVPLLVVIASSHSARSRWVEYEWRSVHNDINSGSERSIVPICVTGMFPESLPRALKTYSALGLGEPPDYNACAKVIAQKLKNIPHRH